ncbi:MAG: ATP-binding cassette domain-containing protein [Coriobacteriales bacterium]|nr:ATP-binding cassette domain-containing protein [Coriobacteriales bacterium]
MNQSQAYQQASVESVVEMERVSKSYRDKKVLNALNLSVKKGEIVAITGRSGAGKSTILNIIGLLDIADSGTLQLFGRPSPKLRSSIAQSYLQKKISYLFQNAALIDQDSVEANMILAQRYSDTPKRDRRQKRHEALSIVGLQGIEKQKVFELSGGEQQRLALACLLVQTSELILADEPTGSLDPKNRDEVLKILCGTRIHGKTIIIATHDPAVLTMADRIISLD